MRPEIIAALYQHTPVFMDLDAFERSLKGWEATSVERDGEVLFIALRRGPEFHFSSMQSGNPLPRYAIRSYLRQIIAEHGYAVTRTPKGPEWERQHRFNRAIGFSVAAEDNDYVTYRMNRVN